MRSAAGHAIAEHTCQGECTTSFDRQISETATTAFVPKAPGRRGRKAKAAALLLPTDAMSSATAGRRAAAPDAHADPVGQVARLPDSPRDQRSLARQLRAAAAIEPIVSTFNAMGVAVYEQTPDAETLLLNDVTPVAMSDDQTDEDAEVNLATVDSVFGRTTDPVRMYMREICGTELLTRADEVEIAKCIEVGLQWSTRLRPVRRRSPRSFQASSKLRPVNCALTNCLTVSMKTSRRPMRGTRTHLIRLSSPRTPPMGMMAMTAMRRRPTKRAMSLSTNAAVPSSRIRRRQTSPV